VAQPIHGWLTERYRTGVTWAIHHRYITLGVSVVAFVISIYLLGGRHRLGVPASPR
jgi:multidrug efflux pump subunit AcrB